RELDQGPQERARGRSAQRPPLLGQRLPPAAARGGVLAAVHAAAVAGGDRSGCLPVRHAPAPAPEGRRAGARTRRSGAAPPRVQPSRRAALGPSRRSLTPTGA